MDEELRSYLKGLHMLPLELDAEAEASYRSAGVDPRRLETHNSPTANKWQIERNERIRTNLLFMHCLELLGEEGSRDYKDAEVQVWEDVAETFYPSLREILMTMPPTTGVVGVYRDPYPLNADFLIEGGYGFISNLE